MPSPLCAGRRGLLLLLVLLLTNRRRLSDSSLRLPDWTSDDGQHVILFHDEVVLAVEPDLLAGILAEQNAVASFDLKRHPLAFVVGLPVADSHYRALLRLLFRAVGDDDSADSLFAFRDALDDDLIAEGSNIHHDDRRLP